MLCGKGVVGIIIIKLNYIFHETPFNIKVTRKPNSMRVWTRELVVQEKDISSLVHFM